MMALGIMWNVFLNICFSIARLHEWKKSIGCTKCLQGTSYRRFCTFFYNYPGFSSLFLNQRDLGEFTKYVKSLSILMTIIILGCIAVWIIYSKIPMSKYNFTYLAFLMTYATALFLPAMHEILSLINFSIFIIYLICFMYKQKTGQNNSIEIEGENNATINDSGSLL